MTLEEKLKIIEEKIRNLPANFDREEKYLMDTNPYLFKLAVDVLLSNPKLCTDEVIRELGGRVSDYLQETGATQYYTNYIYNFLETNLVSYVELEEVCLQVEISEQTQNEFKELLRKRYLDPNLTPDKFNSITNEVIRDLIKFGRYDVISQITKNNIEESMILEVEEIYPFDKYPIPKFFLSNMKIVEKYIDQCSVEDLIIAYFQNDYKNSFLFDNPGQGSSEFSLNVINSIFNKILTNPKIDLSKIEEASQSPNYYSFLYKNSSLRSLKEDQIEAKLTQISLCLFRNGAYELGYQLFLDKQITIEEIRNIIIGLVNNNQRKQINKLDIGSFGSELLGDQELIDLLVSKGYIKEAKHITTRLLEKHNNYINEQLRGKNPDFASYAKEMLYTGSSSYEQCLAMLESGFVEKIKLSTPQIFTELELGEIKAILTAYPQVELDLKNYYYEQIDQILPILIETKRDNSIFDFLCDFYGSDFKEMYNKLNTTKIIDEVIKNDPDRGADLLNRKFSSILEIPELLDIFYEKDLYTSIILNYIHHNEEYTYFYNDENYERLKGYLSRRYQIPIEKVDKLKNLLGPTILRHIENENILRLASLPDEDFDKIAALFPKEQYTLQDLNASYDSLKQYEFSKKHSEETQMFPAILHAIADKDQQKIDILSGKLAKELDSNFLKNFLKKYELPPKYTQDNIIDLVNLVIEKIKTTTGEKLNKYQDILHEMTDYYIARKREQYRETYDMEEELKLPYDYEQKSLDNVLVKHVIMHASEITTTFQKNPIDPNLDSTTQTINAWNSYSSLSYYSLEEYIISKLIEQGVSEEIAKSTIDYYINKDKEKCPNLDQVQKTIPLLIKTVKVIISKVKETEIGTEYGLNKLNLELYTEQADKNNEIKRIYRVESPNVLFEIISQIDIPALQRGVLSNPDIYDSLLQIMKKRKLHLLPSNLSSLLESEHINISSDLSNISGFISYYNAIYESVKKVLEASGKTIENIQLNVANALIYADVYSSVSSVYSLILGAEDAKLIKANPGRNAATRKLANEGRLKEAVQLTKTIYQKQEVTIPTFNQDFSLSTDKKMRIIAGNFSHPSNLTHGERTGACMRIGGDGETLFQFALNDPNGFHIRFEDPETGEYISRVTGFRNGNTIFLNELRYSCNPDKYSNSDVVEACKKASETLIELSKNSPCPIENVVIHKQYAMTDTDYPIEPFNIVDNKEGLPHFYSDIKTSGIVLATTATDKPLAPINFDKTNIPTYRPARERPITCKSIQEATSKINRVSSVKKMLAGENYEYIEPHNFEKGLIYAIVSDDWYVYVDEQGNIIKDIIDIDPRAKEELAAAIIQIETNLAQIQQQSSQEVKYGV